MRKSSLVALALVLILTIAGSSSAQISTGGIRGIVKDATGAVLIGVTVEAESPARMGGAAVAVTNGQGLYQYQGLPVGVYTVTFTLSGFTTLKRENVRVEVGRTVQLDADLSLATTAEVGDGDGRVAGHRHSARELQHEVQQRARRERTHDASLVLRSSSPTLPGVRTNAVTNASNFSVYGSTTDQNSFQYNGVDVSAPSYGSPWDFPELRHHPGSRGPSRGRLGRIQRVPGRCGEHHHQVGKQRLERNFVVLSAG